MTVRLLISYIFLNLYLALKAGEYHGVPPGNGAV